jgi:hypothetical protein
MPGLTERIQTGQREDLADFISIVDAKATPLTSMIKKDKRPTNTLMQWVADAYAAPKTTGIVDGVDVTDYENAAEARAKIYNHIQIFRRTAKTSRLAETVSELPGRQGELAVATTKKLVEIKRDIEVALLSANAAQDDDGTVPNQTRGLFSWVALAASQPAYLPTPSAFCPATAQIDATACASLTEASVQTMLQAIYDNTGMSGDFVLIAGSILRRAFTDFTRTSQYGSANVARAIRTFSGAMSDKKVSNTTLVFEGDYGTVEVIPSAFLNWSAGTPDKDAGLVLDMDRLSLRPNKMPTIEKLPDLGGGPRILIEAVLGLQVDNPIGLGKFQP